MNRKDYACLLLYLSMAVATGFADLRMRAHIGNVFESYIPGVVLNTESAPGAYRVLAPFLVHELSELTGASLQSVWYVTRLLWILFAYCLLHVYLRTWFTTDRAVIGVALTGATFPLTFTNSWPHPDHFPELALFTLGALAIARGWNGLFAVALVAAALNRETSAFLVVLYAVARPLTTRRMAHTAGFALGWAAVYVGLRAIRGLRHYDYWQAGRNLADLGLLPAAFDPYYRAYAYFGLILFGPLLYLALSAREAPAFARRALLVVPCFAAVAFLFSSIIEARIFTLVYPLVLPGVVAYFSSPVQSEVPAER
jgi:hypothetical protein